MGPPNNSDAPLIANAMPPVQRDSRHDKAGVEGSPWPDYTYGNDPTQEAFVGPSPHMASGINVFLMRSPVGPLDAYFVTRIRSATHDIAR